MVSLMCMRCLRRSLESIPPLPSSTPIHCAAFSTSPQLLGDGKVGKKKKKLVPGSAAAKAGKGRSGLPQRQKNVGRGSRAKSVAPTGRKPAVGERRAMAKRIVLSNTNALEVHNLEDLTASKLVRESTADGRLALDAYRSHVLGFDNKTVDAMRALESFKTTQGWSLFRRPASVVRHDTIDLAEHMTRVESEGDKASRRSIIHGPKGSGKSVLLLQAHAMALLKGWFVLHFPEGQDLVNAHTSYRPVETPEGTIYIQPHYTAKLLANFAKANAELLDSLQLIRAHRLPVPVQSNISLARFVDLGAQDPELAWPVWQALWTELLTPSSDGAGHKRPPVLVTMDGIDQTMRPSAYLDPDVQPIHAHDLALPRHFMGLLSARTALPNGGIVLGATCSSNRAASPTFDRYLSNTPASRMPYAPVDEKVQAVVKSVPSLQLQGLSKEEARGLMEYYARSGMLRETVTDGLVNEQWTLSGSGIIGELERATVRTRFGMFTGFGSDADKERANA